MDRSHLRRCIESGERTAHFLRRLSRDAEPTAAAAYWLSLAKSAEAGAAALRAMLDRAPPRGAIDETAVPAGDVSAALAALLDAAGTLSEQWPHLLAEHARIEVPVPAYERRSRRRALSGRPTLIRREDTPEA